MRESPACGGALAELGGQIAFLKDRTFNDVMATLSQHLAVFASQAVRQTVLRTTFDLDAYARGEVDVFVCLTADKVRSHAAVVRYYLSGLVYALVRRGLTRDRNKRILFLLDEIGHLGHVPILEEALTLMRGYGVQLWLFLQGVGQMKTIFPADGGETALANCEVSQFMELNDQATAEYCSTRLGTATISVTTTQRGSNWSHTPGNGQAMESRSYSGNESTSESPAGRKLLLPEEVLGPGMSGRCLVFARGVRPILADRLTCYADPDFPNPTARPTRRGPLLAAVALVVIAAIAAWWLATDTPPPELDAPRFGAPAGEASPFPPR
jgi:type IV secretion system protein VirD4